jgi:hypothetical protein
MVIVLVLFAAFSMMLLGMAAMRSLAPATPSPRYHSPPIQGAKLAARSTEKGAIGSKMLPIAKASKMLGSSRMNKGIPSKMLGIAKGSKMLPLPDRGQADYDQPRIKRSKMLPLIPLQLQR